MALPGAPTLSSPADLATGVSISPTLSWVTGADTLTFDVYLGIIQALNSGDLVVNQAGVTYAPAPPLLYLTDYYWRIDGRNVEGTTPSAARQFTTEEPAPFTLASISKGGAGADGGSEITIVGDFAGESGNEYQVYVGVNANTTDELALSGRPGSPHLVLAKDDRLSFFMPMLDPGIYSITILRADKQRIARATKSMVVVPAQYRSSVFAYRKTLLPWMKAGPRSIALLPPTQVLPANTPDTPVVTGSYTQGDTTIAGTAGNDFATIAVYVNGSAKGQVSVLGLGWSLPVSVLNTADSITAIATTLAGDSAASTPVVVT